MQNCYQYLLTVAEKIISQFADPNTIDKYINLKNKLLGKLTVQTENSRLAFSTLTKDNNQYQILKTSIVEESIKKKSRCESRPSTSKSKSKQNNKLSGARIQSYCSKVTEDSNINSQRHQQYQAILHVAAIMKNAQLCPSMLKTITFYPNSFTVKVNSAIQSIASSLAIIYNELARQDNLSKLDLKQEELMRDNKWLLSRLQTMVDENSTLRRMVGHRVY